MLFVGHSHGTEPTGRPEQPPSTPVTPEKHRSVKRQFEEPYGLQHGERKPIWQEVIHKTRVRICRTPLQWHFDPQGGYCPVEPGANTGRDISHGTLPRPVAGRSDEFAYHLEFVEDLNDGRVHDEGDGLTAAFDGIARAGKRESIPIYQISKIFYTDTGRILNIGSTDEGGNNPVLLLKRDVDAFPPQSMGEQLMHPIEDAAFEIEDALGSPISSSTQAEVDHQLRGEYRSVKAKSGSDGEEHPDKSPPWNLPPQIDPEWLALEVFIDDDEGDDSEIEETKSDSGSGEDEGNGTTVAKTRGLRERSSLDSNLITQIRNISLGSTPAGDVPQSRPPLRAIEKGREEESPSSFVARSPFGSIVSSLSLMEMLLRLTSLQEFQQASHLSIPDHVLTFFLEETSTTGLSGEERLRARNEAKRRVGFDPYTDTPTK